jgi:hypothetical protein
VKTAVLPLGRGIEGGMESRRLVRSTSGRDLRRTTLGRPDPRGDAPRPLDRAGFERPIVRFPRTPTPPPSGLEPFGDSV